MTELVLFLHILAMFGAVAASAGAGFLLHRVAVSGDARAIRIVFTRARPVGLITQILFGVGIIFGLLTGILDGINLLVPWLIITYVLSIVSGALGGGVIGRWAGRVAVEAAKEKGDVAPEALQKLLADRRVVAARWANNGAITLIIVLMVFKPF